MGVSWSICLARFVEGCLSSGWSSSAVCLGMVRYVREGWACFVNCSWYFGCKRVWNFTGDGSAMGMIKIITSLW